MHRQQDDSLDLLGQGVNRIGQMGLQMRDELSLQDRMLEDLDADMEGTHSRLQVRIISLTADLQDLARSLRRHAACIAESCCA